MFDGHGIDLSEIPLSISDEELRLRQSKIAKLCGNDSIIIISNNSESTRSADVEYPYRSSSNMIYFVGKNSPESVLCICNSSDRIYSILFVPPRDTLKETWTGIRLGIEGSLNYYPIDNALSVEEIENELPKLINSGFSSIYYELGSSNLVDEIVNDIKNHCDDNDDEDPINLTNPNEIINEMRLKKSGAEIDVMRYSCKIASASHIVAMKNGKPRMRENQIQAIIEGSFIHNGSQWSYPSIVGGGDNATILHYTDNDDQIEDGELVLIDAGCEVDGYASDITRTWPVNGKFSESQRQLYQLVLDSQIAAIEACKVGASFEAPNLAARYVLAKGLMELGILDGPTIEDALSEGQLGSYFMHRTSHWIGLDVHDVGETKINDKPRTLEVGMVLTIEPGLYFGAWRPDIEIDDKWAGIGIRIEDDVLITENGYEVLTSDCPKTIDELEKIIGMDN